MSAHEILALTLVVELLLLGFGLMFNAWHYTRERVAR